MTVAGTLWIVPSPLILEGMLHALGWHGFVFVDTLGHCAGAVLFGLLIVLLLKDTNLRLHARSRLSLTAAFLVFSWNIAELIVLQAGLPLNSGYRLAVYLSFCFLSVLPAVLLHISLGNRLRSVAVAGYAISLLSIASQYPGKTPLRAEQSRFSLLLLTFGFALLSLGVWLTAEFLARTRREIASPNRVAFVSLFILATSYFHFQSSYAPGMFVGEAIWHQASIPIALLVLLQDYRFFLLDVFLRFTVSACWISVWVWASYSLNQHLQLTEHASGSEFARGILVTLLCIFLYLLARSLAQVQRVFTSVAFRRRPIESLLTPLQSLSGENESELFDTAGALIARHYRCSQWLVEHESAAAQSLGFETGPIVIDGHAAALAPVHHGVQNWAILGLVLRFLQGRSGVVLLGPRAGGQRFLSEDLQDLSRVCAALTERIERFRNDELGRLASQAELRALQAQINPHFLFNALNTLYGTIGRGSPEARQLVLNLAEVFRARLQTNRTYVALNEEIELVRAYLEIEGLRLGSRLRSEIDVDPALGEAPVPVLSIQPLVENAVRHGADKAGNVSVRLSAVAAGGGLTIAVSDRGPGFSPKPATSGTGYGLDNVRQRLRLCYGDSTELVIISTSEGATVRFSVPTRNRLDARQPSEPAVASVNV